jgi:predicted RNA binding protein YcfA (HicA-like mRNA interferase family)
METLMGDRHQYSVEKIPVFAPLFRWMKVRDVIKMIEADGWRLKRTRGSHRHFVHPVKLGVVTVPGHPGSDVNIDTYRSILKQGGLEK